MARATDAVAELQSWSFEWLESNPQHSVCLASSSSARFNYWENELVSHAISAYTPGLGKYELRLEEGKGTGVFMLNDVAKGRVITMFPPPRARVFVTAASRAAVDMFVILHPGWFGLLRGTYIYLYGCRVANENRMAGCFVNMGTSNVKFGTCSLQLPDGTVEVRDCVRSKQKKLAGKFLAVG